jgi:hypothetical protein
MEFVEYSEDVELPDRERQLKILSGLLNNAIDSRSDLLGSKLFREGEYGKLEECTYTIESVISDTMRRTFTRISELKSKERQKDVI